MQTTTTTARRFYCFPETGEVEGPFLLVELAGLLRAQHITGDTQTLIEGEETWLPFKERQEYHFALEIPQEAITRHVKEKADAEVSPFNPRKLLVLVWVLLPMFLYIAYRLFMMYLRYQHSIEVENLDTSGSS